MSALFPQCSLRLAHMLQQHEHTEYTWSRLSHDIYSNDVELQSSGAFVLPLTWRRRQWLDNVRKGDNV